jgi:hypothetical protein
MTTTAAEELPGRVDEKRDENASPEPAGPASRSHAAAVLACLVIVQVTWLAGLAYGAYSLLR